MPYNCAMKNFGENITASGAMPEQPKAMQPQLQAQRQPAQPAPTKRDRRIARARAAAAEQEVAQRQADEAFMRMAIEQAKLAATAGEVPIGAVVVHQPIDRATRKPLAAPRVIATGHNLRETLRNPAAHAEFSAMIDAAGALDAWRLTDCTVYVTLEPCIMCAGLMHQARVSRCVYGAHDSKSGALGSLYNINADSRLNHRFSVLPGVLEEECTVILQQFFQNRRAAKPNNQQAGASNE
jgi:tRNA(adenine34) deaminase